MAACAVLHQLAENAPTIFFARLKDFFDRIWGPLRGECTYTLLDVTCMCRMSQRDVCVSGIALCV